MLGLDGKTEKGGKLQVTLEASSTNNIVLGSKPFSPPSALSRDFIAQSLLLLLVQDDERACSRCTQGVKDSSLNGVHVR